MRLQNMDPDDGRVVSNFICQALRGEPLTLYGDGSQTRSFCYVSDLVSGITTLPMLATNPEQPINIGNPTEFKISELAMIVNELVGNSAGIVYRSFPVDDPMQRKPDISKAVQFLDFKSNVKLIDGLNSTIEYFRKLV